MKQSFICIVTNKRNGTLYTGVTSDIKKRIYQHKSGIGSKFTKKYVFERLVYFEIFDDIENAILMEKQIKANNRGYKISLIESINPNWIDLYDDLF